MNWARLEQQLELHEGCKLHIYEDSEGYDTLGIGYNVSSRGLRAFENVAGRKLRRERDGKNIITREEARVMLGVDLRRVDEATRIEWSFYEQLSEIRQRVVLDMVFNMGYRAASFVKAKAWMERQHWSNAARELYRSKWARQVDDGEGGKFGRADRLVQMLLTNTDYIK